MVEATIFIPLAIIATVQFIKYLAPNVNGAWTILVAVALGALVGVFDTPLGVSDVSVATGIVLGLGAVGITTVANKLGVLPSSESRVR